MTRLGPATGALRLVLLDLDGTLVDSAPDLARAVAAVMEEMGRCAPSVDEVRRWVGDGAARLMARALTGRMEGEPPEQDLAEAVGRFEAAYMRTLCVDTRPYPGVEAGLAALAARDLALGCVTNKPARHARQLLDQLGLARHFHTLVGGGETPRGKPDPAPLRLAAERAGVPLAASLLVGDSRNDVRAARAAGIAVVCVSYGYNHGLDIREAGADAVVDSLEELPRFL